MLARVRNVIRSLTILIVVLTLLIPALILIFVLLWLFDIPQKVGSYISIEDSIRKLLFYVIDPDEMRNVRDDMLHIMESEVNIDLDRWGLLREIDTAQEEIEHRLKDGEFAFTLLGGAAALIIGNGFGILIGGLVLTLVVLIFSIIVALRLIITDALCYQSIYHRNDPIHRLAILRAWNKGPVFGKGAVGIAIISLITTRGGVGYQIGTRFVERYCELKFLGEDKWQVDN